MWKNRQIRGWRGTDEVDGWVDADTLTDRGKKREKATIKPDGETERQIKNITWAAQLGLRILLWLFLRIDTAI